MTTPAQPQDDDPTLEDEMCEVLRRMARALIDDPAELEKRYAEIDEMITKLKEGNYE